MQPRDKVVFYATGKGIIGYGIVVKKFIGKRLIWPREKQEGKPIWPYRFKICVEKVFDKPKPKPKGMLIAFGINKLVKRNLPRTAQELIFRTSSARIRGMIS